MHRERRRASGNPLLPTAPVRIGGVVGAQKGRGRGSLREARLRFTPVAARGEQLAEAELRAHPDIAIVYIGRVAEDQLLNQGLVPTSMRKSPIPVPDRVPDVGHPAVPIGKSRYESGIVRPEAPSLLNPSERGEAGWGHRPTIGRLLQIEHTEVTLGITGLPEP